MAQVLKCSCIHVFAFFFWGYIIKLNSTIANSLHIQNFHLLIAICTKVWNHVNLSIFAFSKVGTCSASIIITSLSIIIIFVVLESSNWYLLHNAAYMPGNLIIKCICERPSFETVQAQESFYSRNFHVQSHTSM